MSAMPEWNDNTMEENDPLTPTATGAWDSGKSPHDSAWAGEPVVDEPAKHIVKEFYMTPKAPAGPPTDEFGRATGIVITWADALAYGFIGREDGGYDVFVHAKNVENGKGLNVGDIVSYTFEVGGKGGIANNVVIEIAANATEAVKHVRETGTVKGWRGQKGYGFISRDNGGSNVFCHTQDIQEVSSLVVGSRVSYRYEASTKGGSAKDVHVEEAAPAAGEDLRRIGIVVSWDTQKGFGFIKWKREKDAFANKRDVTSGHDLAIGQAVSFVAEDGPKGVSAKKIEEEAGNELMLEDELDRLYGRIKYYDEVKGFCFIVRCDGQGDVFGHKRNFQDGVEPAEGMGISFVLESSERGDSAMKIREEEEIPRVMLSDKGREFGTILKWFQDKGFGYIECKKGGENANFNARACNDFAPKKGTCVSFIYERNDKGPTAKDVREDDPERVARVTAKRRFGVIKYYAEPPSEESTNGYGFIIADGPRAYGPPEEYYFHIHSIITPDEHGGLLPRDYVSFNVAPAKKGVQAVDVILEKRPKPEEEKEQQQIDGLAEDMNFGDGSKENDAVADNEKENVALVEDADEWDFSYLDA